jgi:monofunctional biosynthetic peptidoglycan transglycosylase
LRVLTWLKRALRWSFLLGVLLLALFVAALALQSAIEPVSTLMLTRRLFGEPVERQWVSLGAVAPSLKASVILSEDAQFCRHHGVDWGEIRDAVRHGRDNGPARGASTITMQVVKNLFLWPGRSYLRKAIDAARCALEQGACPGSLSQHRRMGAGHLRHRSRGPA